MNDGFLIKGGSAVTSGGGSTDTKSPYDIAVEAGFEGTEDDFNNALGKIDQVVYQTEKGEIGGVASLDDNGKVPYFQLPDFIKTEDKGKADGVASLGADGKIPTSQLPEGIGGGGGGVGKTFVGVVKIPAEDGTDFDREVTEDDKAEIFNDYTTPVYNENRIIAGQPWLSSGNIAAGEYSTAIGNANITSSGYSMIGGFANNDFGGSNSCNLTFGNSCDNSGFYNTVFGLGNEVKTGNDDIPMSNLVAGSNNVITDGGYNVVSGIGNTVDAEGTGNLVVGHSNRATGSQNFVGGYSNGITKGKYNLIVGTGNTVKDNTSSIIGGQSNTEYVSTSGSTTGYGNIICGENNKYFGSNNIVCGRENNITDMYSDNNFISGNKNTLYAEESVAFGSQCTVQSESFGRIMCSFALGNKVKVTSDNSLAGGSSSVASGYSSIAFGSGAKTSGHYSAAFNNATASGSASFACCAGNATGEQSFATNCSATANNFGSTAIGKYNKDLTAGAILQASVGDVFVIGNGKWNNNTTTKSNAFRVTYAGETYGLSAFNGSGADYAEYFEWLDNNPEEEDRVGYFVTLIDDKITIANSDSYILGVVSGQPCMIGNSDEDWLGRWERDEFDRFIKEYIIEHEEEVKVPENGEERLEFLKSNPDVQERKDGTYYRITTEVVDYKTPSWYYKQNPDYDPSQQYIERKDRKEWSAIGMVGVLAVRDDGTCQVNGYCKCNEDGIATFADEYIPGKTFRVIKRVTENVVKVIIK